MSISRTAFVLAVVASACLATPTLAEDLATTVANQLRDSGALSGYRVNVKSKSGTVWLEGRVTDQKQLAAAVGIAESTPGVERVVNRLSIDAISEQPSGASFGLPSSTWGVAGMQAPAQPATIAPPASASPSTNPFSAVTGLFFAGGSKAAETPSQIQLTQGMQPVGRMSPAAAGNARPMMGQPGPMMGQPGPMMGQPGPMMGQPGQMGQMGQMRQPGPMMGQPGQMGPMRQPGPMGQRTAMQTSGVQGGQMMMPGPGYDGPAMDGQMVPGTMQYSEGYAPAMQGNGGYAGGPMPMAGAGVGMPPVPMRADGPNMPNYAWPSYAAYPNYAGLQYPTQYSPTAWPYIGPFYPYPQVPLGWRRVSLEWDDGWWYIDFDDRHTHSHHR